MAQDNVQEMKAQDNGQGAAAAIEMLMHEAWEVYSGPQFPDNSLRWCPQ